MNGPTRRALRCLTAAAVLLALALVAAVLLLGPILASGPLLHPVERAVTGATGLACRIGGIDFAYPFSFTLHDLRLDGSLGEGDLSIHGGKVSLAFRPKRLLDGDPMEIEIDGLEVDLDRWKSAPGGPGDDGIPAWLWWIGRGEVRDAAARIGSGDGAFCLEELGVLWQGDACRRAGELRIARGEPVGGDGDLILWVSPTAIVPDQGPLAFPAVDLAMLLAVADLDLPVQGTVTGVLFPGPGPVGTGSLHVGLRFDDLVWGNGTEDFGFDQGRLRVDGDLVFPQQGEGIGLFVDVGAFIKGVSLDGVPLDKTSKGWRMSGSVGFHEADDLLAWSAQVEDDGSGLRARGAGGVAGLRTGPFTSDAGIRFECRDLAAFRERLAGRIPLPSWLTAAGAFVGDLTLSGDRESMDVDGTLRTAGLNTFFQRGDPVPVDCKASIRGHLRKMEIEALDIRTTSFQVGEFASLGAGLAWGPAGLGWDVTVDVDEVGPLVRTLGPLVPEQFKGFQWGGDLSLSSRGTIGPKTVSGRDLEGRFRIAMEGGRFSSKDFTQMGEGIEGEIEGRIVRSPGGSWVEIGLEGALSKGEVVLGDLYADLSRTRPAIHAGLRLAPADREIDLHSCALDLDGVGVLRVSGKVSAPEDSTSIDARVEMSPVRIDGLVDRVLRDGLAGMDPAWGEFKGSGLVDLQAAIVSTGGSYGTIGRVGIEDLSARNRAWAFALEGLDGDLPFSLGDPSIVESLEKRGDGAVKAGRLTARGLAVRGIEASEIDASVLLGRDRLALGKPITVKLAGGSLTIGDLELDGITRGPRTGSGALAFEGVDLRPVSEALVSRAVEGRVSGRLSRITLVDRALALQGDLRFAIDDGQVVLEGLDLVVPPSGGPSGRCTLRAEGVPLKVFTEQVMAMPYDGVIDADLGAVEITKGALRARGSILVATLGGRVGITNLGAGDLLGPDPFVEADLTVEGIDLNALTSPIDFGRVSGVIEGRIDGLRVVRDFPYVEAFRADLHTVRRAGFSQKIDARAVRNMAKVGGAGALASALTGGLYSFFDEYHYGKIGIRASLEDGWIEIHGIPVGKSEQIIVNTPRWPTISMPIQVLTADRKVRFSNWLSTLRNAVRGDGKEKNE